MPPPLGMALMITILFHCIIYILRYTQFTYSFKLVSIWYFLLRFLAFFLYARLSFSSSSSVLGEEEEEAESQIEGRRGKERRRRGIQKEGREVV